LACFTHVDFADEFFQYSKWEKAFPVAQNGDFQKPKFCDRIKKLHLRPCAPEVPTMVHANARRTFLKAVAASSLAIPYFVPARAFGANDRLNLAAVGVGGKGSTDINNASKGQNVVAICDVDERTLANASKKYTGAKTYHDWRVMLEQKDIDAVTVSTPDHMHAPVAVSAMQLGKHVYVQKPVAHTIFETRQMRKIATEQKVATQMGNQHHSGTGYLTLVDLVRAGAIGKIKEVHTWSNRPIWPQGVGRPKPTGPAPDHLHWDLWLGVAKNRSFAGPSADSKKGRGPYHPFNWRGFLDFGVGALGDMGCHIIDPAVWSCQLAPAQRVWSDGPAPNGETFPSWGIIHYEFAGTKYTAGDTLQVTWYDGGKQPAAELAQLPPGKPLPANGSLFIGEKGVLLCPHGGKPVLLPGKDFGDHKIDLVSGKDHYAQWVDACKGNGTPTSNFDYSGPLTETVLLGTIAIRFPGKKLKWDTESLKVTNIKEANQYVHHGYRKGWDVKGLS
jgi:predicted dehydrogenase